jgi:catechol 2,3-dioxygenase-like lactoylglutathione lyase family enzyme
MSDDPKLTAQRVTGIGGVFFKARDAERLREWYRRHLGLPIAEWGGLAFEGREARPGERMTSTVWSIFPDDSRYFDPSASRFMVNFRVDDLDAVLAALRAEGCDVDPKMDESEYGRFGWVMDPEGNRLELWEPPRV